MNCTEVGAQLQDYLEGRLRGARSRSIQAHLASCDRCSASLDPCDRIERLIALDEEIEPSPSLQARFQSKLSAHRAAGSRGFWTNSFSNWAVMQRATAFAGAAAIVTLGIYLAMFRPGEAQLQAPALQEITIAENLPLLQDLKVIENLELLEDFDTIESLSTSGMPSTVH